MRIFKVAWFVRFARAEGITDGLLRDAVARAERGQVDARLGGGVIKQRIPRPARDDPVATELSWCFAAENEQSLSTDTPRATAATCVQTTWPTSRRWRRILKLSDAELAALLAQGSIEEVSLDEQEISQ